MEKNEIIEILLDWNYWGNYKDYSVERPEYLRLIEDLVKTKEIVVIKGVRRGGKSTIVTHFVRKLIEEKKIPAEHTLIVNFEDPRFYELNLPLLNQIYETYLEKVQITPEYVILDEVQEINGWEKFARFLSEAKKINVIITGSSSKLLSEEYATLLSGRHVDAEVFPLSFKEFLSFKGLKLEKEIEKLKEKYKIKGYLKEYMEFGGFPKICLVEEKEKKLVLQTYFEDILTKDIQKRFDVKEVHKLEQLARYYLTNVSNLNSFNKIKNILNISLDTVERFSKYFSIARLFFFVPKFSFSLKEQILNPKKVYCIDVGLRNVFGFKFSQDIGKIAENIVFLSLFRGEKENIFYWKNTKHEVDFVIKGKKEKIEALIQVCWNVSKEETKKREVDSLIEASKKLNCNKLIVITEDYEKEEEYKGKKICFIPLWKWLL
jgi:hypothetical protein